MPCGVKQFIAYKSVPSQKSNFSPALSSTNAISTSFGVRLARMGIPSEGGHVNLPTVKNLLSASIFETDSRNFSNRGYTKVTFILSPQFLKMQGANQYAKNQILF